MFVEHKQSTKLQQ